MDRDQAEWFDRQIDDEREACAERVEKAKRDFAARVIRLIRKARDGGGGEWDSALVVAAKTVSRQASGKDWWGDEA